MSQKLFLLFDDILQSVEANRAEVLNSVVSLFYHLRIVVLVVGVDRLVLDFNLEDPLIATDGTVNHQIPLLVYLRVLLSDAGANAGVISPVHTDREGLVHEASIGGRNPVVPVRLLMIGKVLFVLVIEGMVRVEGFLRECSSFSLVYAIPFKAARAFGITMEEIIIQSLKSLFLLGITRASSKGALLMNRVIFGKRAESLVTTGVNVAPRTECISVPLVVRMLLPYILS